MLNSSQCGNFNFPVGALIPTTIGGLLSAIGIAWTELPSLMLPLPDGRWRLVATSTPCWIRPALSHWVTAWQEFIPSTLSLEDIARSLWQRSVFDETPEGKSIVRLAEKIGAKVTFDRSKAEG